MKKAPTQNQPAPDLCDTISHKQNSGSIGPATAVQDARVQRTDHALRHALLGLLEQHAFEAIIIRQICAEAGVHYATFFRHHASKEAFLEALARDQMETLLELALPVSQQAGDGAGLDTLCQYIDEHRSLWRVLLTGGASATLRAELLRSSLTVARQKAIAHPSLPMELAATCSVALIIEVITWWLKQPEGAYSRNQVSQMLQQVLGQARLMEP